MNNEKLGEAIDQLESLSYSIQLAVPDAMHVEQMRKELPKLVEELKAGFVEAMGENPWE